MAPTAQEIKVATDTLRKDAAVWDRESATMSNLKSTVDGLTFGRLEAGIFQAIVDANNKLAIKISERCDQASKRFAEIGDTLMHCADTYDAEDAAGKHRIDSLW
ncbi:hypothetical protein AB0L97_30440 [Nocardia sp. NPDC051911]|uniref:hypothetical protein n=1 Tax=Nocardia sp. NPDC051911 TaxID=3154648 RepID=UPI003441DFC0